MFANSKIKAVGMLAAVASASLLSQAPAQAASCPTTAATSLTFSTAFTAGFSCDLGNFVFSNFTSQSADLTAISSGTGNSQLGIWFADDGDGLNYSMAWGYTTTPVTGVPTFGATTPKTYSFEFKAKSTGSFFNEWMMGRKTSATLATDASTPAANLALTALTPNFGSGPATGGAVSEVTFKTSAALVGSSTRNTRVFLVSFNNSEVPGPLPLLGAGTAFAYSRQLRKRTRRLA
jgi:hypothetical protein